MKKAENLIFDWAGVIGDNIQNVYDVAMIFFQMHGHSKITLEQFRETWDQPYMRFYEKYIPGVSLEEEFEVFRHEILKCPPTQAFVGVTNVLRELKESGKAMIVISGDIKETIIPEVMRFGLDGVFLEINHNIHDKVAVIEEIVVRNSFDPSATIFIGDTTHEVEAGKKAGTLTGAVTWGYMPEKRLTAAKPDMIFRSVDELKKLI